MELVLDFLHSVKLLVIAFVPAFVGMLFVICLVALAGGIHMFRRKSTRRVAKGPAILVAMGTVGSAVTGAFLLWYFHRAPNPRFVPDPHHFQFGVGALLVGLALSAAIGLGYQRLCKARGLKRLPPSNRLISGNLASVFLTLSGGSLALQSYFVG